MSGGNALVGATELRARFARRLSDVYGGEIPVYTALLEVSREVNDRAMTRDALGAHQLSSIDRVTAERHGAIRVGTPDELRQISGVAGDIAGVGSTHINHLTPGGLDIDDLYMSMQKQGVETIDDIQGPPRRSGPDVLLRQTSFRALAEPRALRDGDGTVSNETLRVRFGEVEARRVALTAAGRHWYEAIGADIDRRCGDDPDAVRQDVAEQVWTAGFPASVAQLARTELAFFSYDVVTRPNDGQLRPTSLCVLSDGGWVTASPIGYEDFLPRSAAGIFASNLDGDTGDSELGAPEGGAPRERQWLAEAIEVPILDSESAYAHEQDISIQSSACKLGLDPTMLTLGKL